MNQIRVESKGMSKLLSFFSQLLNFIDFLEHTTRTVENLPTRQIRYLPQPTPEPKPNRYVYIRQPTPEPKPNR